MNAAPEMHDLGNDFCNFKDLTTLLQGLLLSDSGRLEFGIPATSVPMASPKSLNASIET